VDGHDLDRGRLEHRHRPAEFGAVVVGPLVLGAVVVGALVLGPVVG
jgi:hypothetical protein